MMMTWLMTILMRGTLVWWSKFGFLYNDELPGLWFPYELQLPPLEYYRSDALYVVRL